MGRNVRLGDLVSIKHGFAFGGEFFKDEPPGDILITPGNFKVGGGFNPSKFKYFVGPVDSEYVLNPGDLIVTMTDLSKAADTLGFPAVVPEQTSTSRYLHNQRIGRVEFNSEAVDKRYLYYLMCSQAYRAEILASATGTTVKHTAPKRIQAFEFILPTIDEQIQIAAILGAIDEKIENNSKLNWTLEAIVRALFKSWFVDFDPVRENAQGVKTGAAASTAALFPDTFEKTEFGETPSGWVAGHIGDLCTVTIGGDWGSEKEFDGSLEVLCLRGADLEALKASGDARPPRRWITEGSAAKRSLETEDVLIAASGAGPTGRSLWAAPGLHNVFDKPLVYSNFCKRLRCASPARAVYLDAILTDMRRSGEIWNYVNGTSIPNLDIAGLLAGKCVLIPPDSVLARYFELVSAVLNRLYNGHARTLASLRDALLPRLISGELRVADAERALEKSA